MAVPAGERVLWQGSALVRLHGAVGDRLLALAAGTGPVVVTDRRVVGVLRPAVGRPALGYELDWRQVDDVGPAASGGVRLLSTALLGAVTLDPVGSCPVLDLP